MNQLLAQKFSVYLMASYLYYREDISAIPDEEFDAICKELLDHWDEFDHIHKHLVCESDLRAGTGFAVRYPNRVISAARQWYRDLTATGEENG